MTHFIQSFLIARWVPWQAQSSNDGWAISITMLEVVKILVVAQKQRLLLIHFLLCLLELAPRSSHGSGRSARLVSCLL